MADDQHYDVVIIGTGAGGGTLGHRLATSGAKVLWLERGPFLPRERDNWETQAVFVRGKYLAPEVWYDGHGREFQPEVNYYVGGNTKFYGAALFRLRPEDFGELRHHGGISPAWPISYDDLEPYYTAGRAPLPRARRSTARTRPRAGERAVRLPAGVPRAPHPAAERRPGEARAAPVPPADRGQPPRGRAGRAARASACIRCDRVDGFPCLVNAQVGRAGDLRRSGAVPGQRHPGDRRQRAAPGDRRLRAHASPGSSPTLDDGSTTTFTGDVVVVACGAVNSAALLLRSRSDRHPDGLANSSGVVGRHYMRHNNIALMAVSLEPNPTRFQKTLAMNDWYLGSDDWEFPLGGIQMLGKSDDEEIRAQAPRWAGKLSPDMPFEVLAHHAVDFWLCGEDLPQAGQPGHGGRGRGDPPQHRREEQRRGRQAAAPQARRDARRAGHAQAPSARPQPLPAQEHADRRDGPPGRHRPLRHATPPRARSTSTARPTTWTTSTWSTPASSRASEP